MAFSTGSDPVFASRQIKLDTLVRLRWLAILGQTAAILLVWLLLGYSFQPVLCLVLVGLSAWLNLYLHYYFRKSVRLPPLPATGLLSYDTCQLGGLLYLTGGLQNPFALLLLVPAVVSATTQPARYTVFLSGLIMIIASLLVFFHQPLPWLNEQPPELPLLYVSGIWIAILITMLFLSAYAFQIAQEGHLLANALSATELILANEQHLSNLDGLATAAAHELGTPLATIQLVTKELQRELLEDDPISDDIELLRSQADRCREILGKLRSLSGEDHHNFTKMRLASLISEIVEPFEMMGIEIAQVFPDDLDDQPILRRNPGVLYGLGNLVENAVEFASSRVEVTAQWTEASVSIRISDDGPGFADAVLHRLGDPYVTTRSGRFATDGSVGGQAGGSIRPSIQNGGGLGLGFFIAKTLLERSGANVKIGNRKIHSLRESSKKSHESGGALIDIVWERSALEANQ